MFYNNYIICGTIEVGGKFMNSNGMNEEFNSYNSYTDREVAVRKTMVGVYGWMAFALLISAMSGLYFASNIELLYLLFSGPAYWAVVIGEVAIVVMLSRKAYRMSSTAAKLWFVVYAILNGVTFGSAFAVYGLGVAGYAFLVTAIVFAVMTVYGYVTKTDLSSIGNLFVMALIGLIVASLMNTFFIRSEGWTLAIMYISVIIFIGLIGYDTQKIKQLAYAEGNGVSNAKILGALVLYLDFINIFISLVNIMGKDN